MLPRTGWYWPRQNKRHVKFEEKSLHFTFRPLQLAYVFTCVCMFFFHAVGRNASERSRLSASCLAIAMLDARCENNMTRFHQTQREGKPEKMRKLSWPLLRCWLILIAWLRCPGAMRIVWEWNYLERRYWAVASPQSRQETFQQRRCLATKKNNMSDNPRRKPITLSG